jgi:hypothetical protein
LLSALAISTIAIAISSCGTNRDRIIQASTVKGEIRAGIDIGDIPADCRAHEAHADLAGRAELHAKLIEERQALDRQNARTDRCAAFDDTRRENFKHRK